MMTALEDGRSAAMIPIPGCQRHCLADERPDHRLGIYHGPAGELMCRAQAGLIFSEMRVTPQTCGSDRGCDGMWRCFKVIDRLMPEIDR